jgi:hypothetical protein
MIRAIRKRSLAALVLISFLGTAVASAITLKGSVPNPPAIVDVKSAGDSLVVVLPASYKEAAGKKSPERTTPGTPIPEAGTLVLLGVLLLSAASYMRRVSRKEM